MERPIHITAVNTILLKVITCLKSMFFTNNILRVIAVLILISICNDVRVCSKMLHSAANIILLKVIISLKSMFFTNNILRVIAVLILISICNDVRVCLKMLHSAANIAVMSINCQTDVFLILTPSGKPNCLCCSVVNGTPDWSVTVTCASASPET